MSAALAPSPEIALILRHVAEHYSIPASRILSPCRRARVAEARATAMFLMCALTDMSLPALGRVTGRHHTTVLAARDKIRDRAERHPRIAAELEGLAAHIGAGASPTARYADVEGLAERVERLERRARWGSV